MGLFCVLQSLPRTARVGLGQRPYFPPPILPKPRGEGVVEAKHCGEAGSAPIWRVAVAGKQGAEGTCVTSFSLLSLLPSPTGPCPSLGGAPGPRLQMGDGSDGKGVQLIKRKTGLVGELFSP